VRPLVRAYLLEACYVAVSVLVLLFEVAAR
jgi:hypothetical protein